MEEAERIRPRLVVLARRYVGEGGEADDMVQDAMLKLWTMRGELRSPMERLACVVVRNLCMDCLRRRKPEAFPLLSAETAAVADDTDDAEAGRLRAERMMGVVARLPDSQQAVLRLRHVEGMEMADIAGATGRSEAAVRKALSRARQAVRDIYFKERANNDDD